MKITKSITLRRITANDIPLLLEWRNSISFRHHLCTKRKAIVNEAEFRQELQDDFRYDRCEQVLILVAGLPAGTAFAYRYSKAGKHVYVSLFLSEKFCGHAIGVYALADFVMSIFSRFDLHKIYFEVYSYNRPVVRLLNRLGFQLEGVFKGHCLDSGRRHDLLIFALYRKLAEDLRARFRGDEREAQAWRSA